MTDAKNLGRIPFSEYLEIDAVNASSLKPMAVSPLQYQHNAANGGPDSSGFALGTPCHTAILEPEQFIREYVEQPETRTDDKGSEVNFIRRGKYWDAFCAANPGKTPITRKVHETAWAVSKAVRRNPEASALLADPGETEVSIVWTHPVLDMRCKARVDKLGRAVPDLKTTKNVEAWSFAADAARMKYHWSAAFYQDAVQALTGEVRAVPLIVIQATAPHDCIVYDLPARAIEHGRKQYIEAMWRLQECRQKGDWPGIGHRKKLTFPVWALGAEETPELTIGGEAI